MEPPWEGGNKVHLNGLGHMTKMAAMSIYGKNLKDLLPQNYSTRTINMKLGMEHYVLRLYKVYINSYPELTLTHFKTMSSLTKLVFVLTVGPDIR